MDDELRAQLSTILARVWSHNPNDLPFIRGSFLTQPLDSILELFQAALAKERGEIVASLPTANPRKWAVNQPQMAWTLGFEKAIDQVWEAIEARGKHD